jgi:hypothetical protein
VKYLYSNRSAEAQIGCGINQATAENVEGRSNGPSVRVEGRPPSAV